MNKLKKIFKEKYPHKEKPLPHHKRRPNGVHGIIIHSMGEYIEGGGDAVSFLDTLGLSAHYLIEPDGTVIECVDPDRQAYHAGISKFNGEEDLNKTFIGIEVLVEGTHTYETFKDVIQDPDTFTDHQHDSTAVLCAMLMYEYPDITMENIVRHSDVSGEEVRPQDPKLDVGEGFSWTHFKALTNVFYNQLKSVES